MVACALIAQPLASNRGAKFLFLSFSHANIMDGPEIQSIIPTMARGIFHQTRLKNPVRIEVRTDPIAPRAKLRAANIPTNFPMSKA